MKTIHNFHSFIKLVRLMFSEQQAYFKSKGDSNLKNKCIKLEAKVDAQLHELSPESTQFYEWQQKFVSLIKELRKEQIMFFKYRSDGALNRSRSLEGNLKEWLTYLENKYPSIFVHVETAKQQNLFHDQP